MAATVPANSGGIPHLPDPVVAQEPGGRSALRRKIKTVLRLRSMLLDYSHWLPYPSSTRQPDASLNIPRCNAITPERNDDLDYGAAETGVRSVLYMVDSNAGNRTAKPATNHHLSDILECSGPACPGPAGSRQRALSHDHSGGRWPAARLTGESLSDESVESPRHTTHDGHSGCPLSSGSGAEPRPPPLHLLSYHHSSIYDYHQGRLYLL